MRITVTWEMGRKTNSKKQRRRRRRRRPQQQQEEAWWYTMWILTWSPWPVPAVLRQAQESLIALQACILAPVIKAIGTRTTVGSRLASSRGTSRSSKITVVFACLTTFWMFYLSWTKLGTNESWKSGFFSLNQFLHGFPFSKRKGYLKGWGVAPSLLTNLWMVSGFNFDSLLRTAMRRPVGPKVSWRIQRELVPFETSPKASSTNHLRDSPKPPQNRALRDVTQGLQRPKNGKDIGLGPQRGCQPRIPSSCATSQYRLAWLPSFSASSHHFSAEIGSWSLRWESSWIGKWTKLLWIAADSGPQHSCFPHMLFVAISQLISVSWHSYIRIYQNIHIFAYNIYIYRKQFSYNCHLYILCIYLLSIHLFKFYICQLSFCHCQATDRWIPRPKGRHLTTESECNGASVTFFLIGYVHINFIICHICFLFIW